MPSPSLIKRRKLLLVGGCAAAASLASAQTTAAREKLSVTMDFLPSWRHAAFHLANVKGWYADAGLEVEVLDGSGSSTTILQTSLNKTDIGLASLAAYAVARGKGTEAVAIAGIVRRNDLGMLVDSKLGLTHPRQLAERNASVIFEATSFQSLFPPFFKNAGIDMSKIKLLPMSAASAIGTYLSGQADALITTVPYALPLTQAQRPSQAIMFGDHGMPLPGHGLVASPQTLNRRPEAVRKFLAVTSRAWEQVWNGNAEECIAALHAQRPMAKIDPSLELKRLQAYRPYSSTPATQGKPVLWMAPSDWDAAAAVMRDAALIPAGLKSSDLFTNAFLPA